ncbi:hypothetical protein CRYUN_Cryun17cG0033800 [Craigia yunnanensis]
MAKLVAAFFLALIAIPMLQSMVMASPGHGGQQNIMALEVSRATNVHHSARGGAARPNTISHACSSVRNAVRNACVFLQGIMGTKLCALATTTGRPRKEDPSALKLEESFPIFLPFILSLFPT